MSIQRPTNFIQATDWKAVVICLQQALEALGPIDDPVKNLVFGQVLSAQCLAQARLTAVRGGDLLRPDA